MAVGTPIDTRQDTGDGEYQRAEYLCQSYYAEAIGDTHYCVWGPEAQFDDYKRGYYDTSSDATCTYVFTDPVTQEQSTRTTMAACGPNYHYNRYCRRWRTQAAVSQHAAQWQQLWAADCHAATSLVKCAAVL